MKGGEFGCAAQKWTCVLRSSYASLLFADKLMGCLFLLHRPGAQEGGGLVWPMRMQREPLAKSRRLIWSLLHGNGVNKLRLSICYVLHLLLKSINLSALEGAMQI